MGFTLTVPQNVPFSDRVLTMKFSYQRSGDVIMVFYKWKGDTRFNEQAVYKKGEVGDLLGRFTISRKPPANVHAVFVVDRSGSMGVPMTLKGEMVHAKNKTADAVGDVFCGGIYQYVKSRFDTLGAEL